MQMWKIACLFFLAWLKVAICAYCDKQSLSFSGVVKNGTRFYLSGEGFLPSCETGYQLARPGEKILCRNGHWTGYFPPCNVVSCHSNPPPLQNGRLKSYSGLHGSIAKYECNELYLLVGESTVQCLFGEWKGTLPVCKDTRCYFHKLKNKSGVLDDKRTTFSGEFLSVRCSDGFSPSGLRPTCSRGDWIEEKASPCKEKDCPIRKLNNGTLKEIKERKVWKFGKFRYERKLVLVEVTKEGVREHGHQLYLTCETRHNMQVSRNVNTTTTCQRGKWQPEPVCLHQRK